MTTSHQHHYTTNDVVVAVEVTAHHHHCPVACVADVVLAYAIDVHSGDAFSVVDRGVDRNAYTVDC